MRRSLAWALILLSALLLPGSAEAASRNRNLSAAITLYGDLEYEAALEHLQRAEKESSLSAAEEVQINLYMGLILFELGDAAGSAVRFKRALALDEKVALPKAVSPKTAIAFENARRAIEKSRAHSSTDSSPPASPPRPAAPPPPAPVAPPPPPAAAGAAPAATEPTPPAPAPVAQATEETFQALVVAVRGDIVAFRAAAAGGLTLQLDSKWVGGALSVLAPKFAIRLEGRFHPVELSIVRPYLAIGATMFPPVVGLRGALGAELRLSRVRLALDVAYERYVNAPAGYSADVVLIGGGVGWSWF